MGNWIALKKRAREQHTQLLAQSGGNPSAKALLDAAECLTGIKLVPCPAGDPLLEGADAVLDPNADTIWYNEDVDPGMAAFYQMHEYAHLWLHNKACRCEKKDLNAEAAEEEAPLGVARVEAYSPRERVEREANIFAREVLLPSNVVRQWFLNEDTGATEMANRIGVPEGLVFHQMAYALLLSDLVEKPEESRSTLEKFKLDRSQKPASEWTGGPLLVEAGPGTGKTRTLIGRIEFLLKQGVSPSSILALTFSNKAAEEMRSRVAIATPEAPPLIWMGTFHAFGLELLRKHGSKMGIRPDFRILDPVEALFLSERLLPSLELLHYQNLYEPTMYLPDILAAISRAKDELLGPNDYMALAEGMRNSAQTEDEILTAEKAIEVARVYACYQENLEKESLIDFGDLIFRSVSLLRRHRDVKESLKKTYAHVLVDEYQDVNRASGVLLKEIAGDGNGLWVVGDTRQSIYRFRGAAPANMKLFPKDFPGALTKPLKINYRSRPSILATFAALAPKMRASNGQIFTPWESHRNDRPGIVRMEVAEDLNSEVDGIAREIKRLNAEGTPFLNQAILCRSHTIMARIALKLEEAGIPILYLGNLFERDEIRNLLSLVSLACDGSGRGLIRVAQFPEYNIPLADVLALIKESRAEQMPFLKALEIAENLSDISPEGKAGLARLNAHISGICYGTNAWGMLVRYLFARSNHLKPLLKDTSLSARQKRIAIYQFLQFAHAQRENVSIDKNDPKRAFLRYVRRLEINGDERQLRQVPEWASGLNAVRLLTVHASKGLEFDAVFIPHLGQGYFPARKQGNPCPPPAGMISPEFLDGAHEEEEECLFFVSLSRAKEFLCLSRAVRYGNRNSNPSSILLSIQHQLPHLPSRKVTWRAKLVPSGPPVRGAKTTSPSANYDIRDLEIYINCPRKYFYERVLTLAGKREDSAYVSFHNCIYKVLRWMGEERAKGHPMNAAVTMAKLNKIWTDTGPIGHPYEIIYKKSADEMVSRAVHRAMESGKPLPPTEWVISLRHGMVRIAPDFLEETTGPEGRRIQVLRFRTGRPTKSEYDKEIYAAYQAAMEKEFCRNYKMKLFYLSSGELQEVPRLNENTRDRRLDKYDEAIVGIQGLRFSPGHNELECPRCPHYFICPAPEDT